MKGYFAQNKDETVPSPCRQYTRIIWRRPVWKLEMPTSVELPKVLSPVGVCLLRDCPHSLSSIGLGKCDKPERHRETMFIAQSLAVAPAGDKKKEAKGYV